MRQKKTAGRAMDFEVFMNWLGARSELDSAAAAALGFAFIVGAFLPFPRTVLLIAAGVVLGAPALIVIVPCATLGSLLSFMLARHLFRDWFLTRASRYPHFRSISSAVDAEGWRVVALMRLGIPIPSSLQNYLFAMTGIGLVPFVGNTFLFSIPQAALFVHLGSAGRDSLVAGHNSTLDQISLALGIAASATLIVLLGRHSRRKLSVIADAS
jgi:uncharacterized membrane protein YdjX (TVP38/TMEM64 family)